jgi:hypothetical protein
MTIKFVTEFGKSKIKFPANNDLPYRQDFAQWRGIPWDVEFEITFLNRERTAAKLTATGYGGNPYGNGALYISKDSFEKARLEDKENEHK